MRHWHIFATRRADFYGGSIVAVKRSVSPAIGGRNGEDPIAVGWLVSCGIQIAAVVACGNNNNRTRTIDSVNCVLIRFAAYARATQAHIEHLSRERVCRDAAHRQPGRPAHTVGDI